MAAALLMAGSLVGACAPTSDLPNQKPHSSSRVDIATRGPGEFSQRVHVALNSAWGKGWRNSVIPFNRNSAATRPVAAVYGPAFSGVGIVDVATGQVLKQIEEFENPTADQAGGEANARFAVWKQYHSAAGLDDYTVKLWDRNRDEVRRIGANRVGPDGHPFSSPWQDPILADTHAAWVEGTDYEGGGEIVLADLERGRRHVVSQGHANWLAFVGKVLMWSDSPAPGQLTEVHAIDIQTRKPVRVPSALRGVRGPWGFVSNGRDTAWVKLGRSSASLYMNQSGSAPARRVLSLRSDGFSPPVTMNETTLAISRSSGGLVLVDLRSGRWAFLKKASAAFVAGDTLLVSQANSEKVSHPRTALAVLTPADIATIRPRD